MDLLSEFVTEGLELITSAEDALLSLENDPEDMDAVGNGFSGPFIRSRERPPSWT